MCVGRFPLFSTFWLILFSQSFLFLRHHTFDRGFGFCFTLSFISRKIFYDVHDYYICFSIGFVRSYSVIFGQFCNPIKLYLWFLSLFYDQHKTIRGVRSCLYQRSAKGCAYIWLNKACVFTYLCIGKCEKEVFIFQKCGWSWKGNWPVTF